MSGRGSEEARRSFQIRHGGLTITVPYTLFKGNSAIPDPDEVERFLSLLSSRYPWLSTYALDIIVENARNERQRMIIEGQSTTQRARGLLDRGSPEMALVILDKHLEENPEDAEALYAKGEALCRLGRGDDGYRCIARARYLSQ